MNFLTNILYWVSMAFLMPVVVFLIVSFIGSLLMLGSFYGIYLGRLKFREEIGQVLLDLKEIGESEFKLPNLSGHSRFAASLNEAGRAQWRSVHTDKILADFELKGEKELESSKILIRVGPMLGLMGTLIPLGPALVALASGNMTAMAVNMQVAFSTTVIGVFCGAVGFVTHLVKKRWFIEDLNNLQYLFDLARSGVENDKKTILV
ncbi:MAG: MotA/TolQ/ExbB proton channel family protein [Candidatus Omnitrophica bacterium]|nr:MotA/TolQ/ExbB proton channel family protein [Candidatus Omnitrophota bacterium]